MNAKILLPFKKKYQENNILQKIGTCIIFRNFYGCIKCIENSQKNQKRLPRVIVRKHCGILQENRKIKKKNVIKCLLSSFNNKINNKLYKNSENNKILRNKIFIIKV